MDKDMILRTLDARSAELKEFGVERIGLFGSFIRGENREDSDIDFLVDFDKEKKTLRNLVYLGDFLEDLFGRKVDIVSRQGLSKYIGPHILKDVQYATLNA
jgi:predicted nucleotidyltransferase